MLSPSQMIATSTTTTTTTTMKNTVKKIIEKQNGSFQRVTWKSQVTPAAEHKKNGITLEKITRAIVRAGVNFANLASVKEGIENGERGEVESLPWGAWENFPFTIQHKGERFVRLYPVESRKGKKTSYFVNGKEVDKQTFQSFMRPSDVSAMSNKKLCFCVKEENILEA